MTMRSLSTRMLLAALSTLLVSFLAFVVVFFVEAAPKLDTLFRRFQAQQLSEAVAALEHGGAPAAAAYLDRLARQVGVTYYLLDARGHDILTGTDRSALLVGGHLGRPRRVNGTFVLTEASADGRFRLVALVPPQFDLRGSLPYYLVIPGAVALLWWLIAIGIASPIRQLTTVVARFGRGDLDARAPVARRDEIGNLEQAFNEMAERIQTLMTAERRLLQDISHELRSPLARLSIAAELLRTTGDRERAIARVQDEVERLTQLVGSLVEMTRSEADPSARRSQPVDIEAIVRETAERCRLESDLHGCRIVVRGNAPTSLVGDPELIRRAVENVLRNAIRYAPPDTAIDVLVTEDDKDATVSVRDVGPGVPEPMLPRLTEAFFRVDAARDADTGGVGLGLAIANRALRLHHGTVVAENAHPGLRVTLRVPHAAGCRVGPAA